MTPPTTAPTTPRELLGRIRHDVYRLALPTLVPAALAGSRGTRVTRDPLLADLRAAIRPDTGGTGSGRSASSSERIPLDPDALKLYQDVVFEISAVFEMGTDRTAIGTPEQLLIEWWIAFLTTPDKNAAMLANYAGKLSRWRHRIERHFDRPRQLELGACPSCGYTHHDVVIDGDMTRQRTLVGTWWPDNPERGISVGCRYCGATWTNAEFGSLELELQLSRAFWGRIEYALAPPRPEAAIDGSE